MLPITNRADVTRARLSRNPRYPSGGTVQREWRETIETFQLPPVLDLNVASTLRDEFLGRRGSALRVDASRVERLGGLCLQVLIAARAAWAEDRQELMVDALSSELEAGLIVFGVAPQALNYREE